MTNPFGFFLALVLLATALPCSAGAQDLSQRHHLYNYEFSPGEIGQRKLLARHSMVGYFQPVQLKGPGGTKIQIYSQGAFQPNQDGSVAGLLVGHVYRLKVTNIPGYPGKELYPSVEIIGRLNPPAGQETRFPIPVNLHAFDLDPAIDGSLVTRVIYLENPRTAIAERRTPDDQPFFDVGLAEDPIRVAETLGRPMAILRIGSRVPDQSELDSFGFGTPPMTWFPAPAPAPLPTNTDDASADAAGKQTSVKQVAWKNTQQGSFSRQASSPESSQGLLSWSLGDTDECVDVCPAPANSVQLPAVTTSDPFFHPSVPGFRLPPFQDEVLIDGGDRNLKAVVKDDGKQWNVLGLDAEDTIAHFDTLDGRRIVDASNRVEIYAPRFSAVRKLDNLGRTQYTNELARIQEDLSSSSTHRNQFSSTTLQNLQPARHRRNTQPIGLENRTRGLPVENGLNIRGLTGDLRTHEDLRLMRSGILDNREKGRLGIAIQRAVAWNSDISAQSTTRNLQVTVAASVKQAREAVHVKNEKNRPQIRLVKIASTNSALPGEFVEFTIRFDNVGDQTIGNVTIIDNLTGRLEYVADSSECSLPGRLVTEPNKSGSKILRWEITDPLEPTKGGMIRFKCRVR